jgi:hypothetical protein
MQDSISNDTNSPLLTGTWPVRTHSDQFFGTVKADGQHPRVAALACYKGDLVFLSLVGYDTSTSAVLANLWLRESVPFLVGDGVQWRGPRHLKRRPEGYKQFSTQLTGTKEMHYIALPLSAHIAEGILHPPDLPAPPKEGEDAKRAEQEAQQYSQYNSRYTPTLPMALPEVDRTRFVLGNGHEDFPHQRSFLGHLYAMRVLFLHRHEQHPEWPAIWAGELWRRGLTRKLVVPLSDALGMKAWMLAGDLVAWGNLIGDGVRDGWLPWQDGQEEAALHIPGIGEESSLVQQVQQYALT